jgi:tetratricopeptide (TPR) repeat protein
MSDIELKRAGNRALAARDYETARRAFEALIERSPDSLDGYVGLSRVLERTHDQQAIVDLLEPVLARMKSGGLAKVLGDAYRVLANRGARSAVEPAIRWYETYLRDRRDPVTLYYLAELQREHAGNYETALRLLEESWKLDPGSRSVYDAAQACARKLGRLDEVRRIQETWKGQLR